MFYVSARVRATENGEWAYQSLVSEGARPRAQRSPTCQSRWSFRNSLASPILLRPGTGALRKPMSIVNGERGYNSSTLTGVAFGLEPI